MSSWGLLGDLGELLMGIIAQSLEVLENIVDLEVVGWDAVEEAMQQRVLGAIALPSTPVSTPPHCLVYPRTVDQLSGVITLAHRNHWRILPCGSGTKLPWGGLAEGITIVVSTAKLNRLIEHAAGDLTVTAEAGMRLVDLQAILAKQGQFLPLDPAYAPDATLGGIVATADVGALRHRYGGVRDLLIGITLVRADGQVAKAGGRVVKNVAGYDLMKLFTGSWGTLGILSQLTLRVYPLPEASQTLVLTGDVQAIARATQTLLSSALTPTAVELVIAPALPFLKQENAMALLVRFQGIAVGVATQVQQFTEVGQALGLAIATTQANETVWQQLQQLGDVAPNNPVVTCKIGVTPSMAVTVLEQIKAFVPQLELAQIHAGSGLGRLRFASTDAALLLPQLRQICEAKGGFLTILEAPHALKQQVDVWGYTGNAIALMRGIKQQFDPTNLLSPSRFVGGI